MKAAKTPRPPTHFTDKTRGIWREIMKNFELEVESVELLRVSLENLDLADRAREQLRTEGLTVAGKRNPASDLAKQCDGMFFRGMRQLGLDIVQPHSGVSAGRRA